MSHGRCAAPKTVRFGRTAFGRVFQNRDRLHRELSRPRKAGDAVLRHAAYLGGGRRCGRTLQASKRQAASTPNSHSNPSLGEGAKPPPCSPVGRAFDFAELHTLVAASIQQIHGIGPLTVYDITTRVGAFLGLEPGRVYLHAGTAKGARNLGLETRASEIPMEALPGAFRQLTPAEAEDCLCIYRRKFHNLAANE